MSKDIKMFSTNVALSNFEKVNPEFARVKVHVCYSGENRNRTHISRATLDKMAETIYGIPVVGEYDGASGEFQGHGGKLEITDGGIEFVQTTKPYGFVDPSTKVTYEKVREIDGITENEYLTCYAYLWYKRYPELETVLSDGAKQSMEISVQKGDWNEDGLYDILDGNFSALCILQSVEPCFESSTISSNFALDSIKEEYEEMIKTFKQYALDNIKKEGEEMADLEKNTNFEETTSVCEVETDTEETKEQEKTQEEEIQEETQEEEIQEETQEEEIQEETQEEEIQEETQEEANYELIIEELNKTIDGLNSNYTKLLEEVERLREFKNEIETTNKKSAIEELFSKYENVLSKNDEFKALKEKAISYEALEDLEKDIALIYAKQTINFSSKVEEGKKIKVPVFNVVNDDGYGGLLKRYGKK